MIKLKDLLNECDGCERGGTDWTHGHDHEGSMAKSEVADLIKHATDLYAMIGPDDQLPGWVSGYITLAADYIHSVTEHLAGKADEMMPEQLMAESKKRK